MDINYDFSLLPEHIIVQILNYLRFNHIKNVIATCQSWYYASYHPKITKKITLHLKLYCDSFPDIHRPFSDLIITTGICTNTKFIEFISKHGTYIKEIVFHNCILSLHQFINGLSYLTNLSTLEIISDYNDVFMGSSQISEETSYLLDQISDNLKRVKTFSITMKTSSYFGLYHIMCKLSNLEHLRLNIQYRSRGNRRLLNSVNNWDEMNLKNLHLNSTILGSEEFYNDFREIMIPINIERLEIYRPYKPFIHPYFSNFCSQISNLRILCVNGVCSDLLRCIWRPFAQLEKLILNKLYSPIQGIHTIGKFCHLKKLHISFDRNVTYPTMEPDIIEMFTSNLKNLESLHFNNYIHITQSILLVISEVCQNLNDLTLKKLNTRKVEPIFKNLIRLRRLKLVFAECNEVPDKCGEIDIKNLNLLRRLEISHFTTGMTRDLICQLPNLKKRYLPKN